MNEADALDLIIDWCDKHGWNELGSSLFCVFLEEQGIDPYEIQIFKRDSDATQPVSAR